MIQRLILGLSLLLLATNRSEAEYCGLEDIENKDTNLPIFVVVDENEPLEKELEHIFGCKQVALFTKKQIALTEQEKGQFTEEQLGQSEQITGQFREGQLASWVPLYNFIELWKDGLIPRTIKRIRIEINSMPDGAKVIIQDELFGNTSVSGLIKSDYISSLRLELDGYEPCYFDNNLVIKHTVHNMVLHCEMVALK